LTIREIADELSFSFGTCQAILTQDLGRRRVSAKFVPHAALSVGEFLAKHNTPWFLTRLTHKRFGFLRLLPLPQAEERPEGETISRRRLDITKFDTAVAGHSQTSLPDMH
jgi:hypothetical protein